MTTVRSIQPDDLVAFARIQGEGAEAFGAQLRSWLEEGGTRLDWCFVSDVDVLNRLMAAAMERARHSPGARPWHVWHYRY